MGAPGTIHYLRAGDTPNADRVALLRSIDPADTSDCHRWTIGGRKLTPEELEMAHQATLADAHTAGEMIALTGEQCIPSGVFARGADGYLIQLTSDEPPDEPPAA